MLIGVKKLKSLYKKFNDIDEELLKYKLEAIESSIRAYTNNSFQCRAFREACYTDGSKLVSVKGSHLFKVGDTVQISLSKYNDGLYVVTAIGADYIEVDKELVPSEENLVTKVAYPFDVIDGAASLLEWDFFKKDKQGIASETISRHSVSYQTYDGTNTIGGYPASLYGFCKPYMRARV